MGSHGRAWDAGELVGEERDDAFEDGSIVVGDKNAGALVGRHGS